MYTRLSRLEVIGGWGNYPRAKVSLFRPERINDLVQFTRSAEGRLLARGGGTSYGDASMSQTGSTINMERMAKFLSFDAATGLLHCEAGVEVGDIVATLFPKGFILPVTPGTQRATIGGLVATDAHGKNAAAGSISNFVRGFHLLCLPDQDVLWCDEDQNSDLFFATMGGMGATGIIVDALIEMRPITSPFLDVETRTFDGWAEVMTLLREGAEEYEYQFAWLDSHAGGGALGRGVLWQANHRENEPMRLHSRRRLSIPFNLPALRSRALVYLYNRYHFMKNARGGRGQVHAQDFFYPLDHIENWNRLYGRRGFLEYQIAIPTEAAESAIPEILAKAAHSKLGSIVAAIKPIMAGRGSLSFGLKGITLAIDFAFSKPVLALLDELDEIVASAGGRVYLAKDGRLGAEKFRRMYGTAAEEWNDVRRARGVADKYGSDMFDRLLAA